MYVNGIDLYFRFYEIRTNKVGQSSSWVLEIDGIHSFTIGDGEHYNGSYNIPLEPGTTYNVAVRIVTKAQNGVSVEVQKIAIES